jgi:hypothetical protein
MARSKYLASLTGDQPLQHEQRLSFNEIRDLDSRSS